MHERRRLSTKTVLACAGLWLGISGCEKAMLPDYAPTGWMSGKNEHVTTPASGANAQGQKKRRVSNDGMAMYVTERCHYPDVTAEDRRQKLGDCVNTFQVGADEQHGKPAQGTPEAAH